LNPRCECHSLVAIKTSCTRRSGIVVAPDKYQTKSHLPSSSHRVLRPARKSVGDRACLGRGTSSKNEATAAYPLGGADPHSFHPSHSSKNYHPRSSHTNQDELRHHSPTTLRQNKSLCECQPLCRPQAAVLINQT